VSKCWKQEKSNWKCLGSSSQDSAQSGSTGLSGGASDSVRCARLARANRLLSGLRRRCTAIIHRTVRWCTGLSGGPFTGELVALGKPSTAYGYNSPDCPVYTNGSQTTNGRLRHLWKEIGHRTVSGVHRTVRCTSQQKAISAFLECSQRLLAALGL
jgi:hypothetical protein